MCLYMVLFYFAFQSKQSYLWSFFFIISIIKRLSIWFLVYESASGNQIILILFCNISRTKSEISRILILCDLERIIIGIQNAQSPKSSIVGTRPKSKLSRAFAIKLFPFPQISWLYWRDLHRIISPFPSHLEELMPGRPSDYTKAGLNTERY